MAKVRKEPGPDHPITIAPLGQRVTVKIGGTIVAESINALALQESTYPRAIYIPRGDVRMELASRTTASTYCPYKGDASYYSFAAGGTNVADAAWSYEAPFPAMAQIKDHLAFYASKAEIA